MSWFLSQFLLKGPHKDSLEIYDLFYDVKMDSGFYRKIPKNQRQKWEQSFHHNFTFLNEPSI